MSHLAIATLEAVADVLSHEDDTDDQQAKLFLPITGNPLRLRGSQSSLPRPIYAVDRPEHTPVDARCLGSLLLLSSIAVAYLWVLWNRRILDEKERRLLWPYSLRQKPSTLASIPEELPDHIVKEQDLSQKSATSKSCHLCFADFEVGERVAQLPSCAHIFCQDCVGEWLLYNNSCPICKCQVSRSSSSNLMVLIDPDELTDEDDVDVFLSFDKTR